MAKEKSADCGDKLANKKESVANWGNLHKEKPQAECISSLSSPSVYLDNLKMLYQADIHNDLADSDSNHITIRQELEKYNARDENAAKAKKFLQENFSALAKTKENGPGISPKDMDDAIVDNLAKAIASTLRADGDVSANELDKAFRNHSYRITSPYRTGQKSEQVLAQQFQSQINQLLKGTPYQCQFALETLPSIHGGDTVRQMTLHVEKNGKRLPNSLQFSYDLDR